MNQGNQIHFDFSHFYLENSELVDESKAHVCNFDYLEIIEKDAEDDHKSSKQNRYCNEAPPAFTTETDAAIFNFHTDASASGTGFRLEWQLVGCGGRFVHPTGSIQSPNYPKQYCE